jgi:hypothetical protein
MPMRAFQLLQQAGQKREQAERARRLATATTAADVSDALLTYTRQLDEQARPLEERAVELATSETRQRPSSRNEEDAGSVDEAVVLPENSGRDPHRLCRHQPS